MPRNPYGLAWRLALCRAVLRGHLVSARMETTYADRATLTTFVLDDSAVRRWKL